MTSTNSKPDVHLLLRPLLLTARGRASATRPSLAPRKSQLASLSFPSPLSPFSSFFGYACAFACYPEPCTYSLPGLRVRFARCFELPLPGRTQYYTGRILWPTRRLLWVRHDTKPAPPIDKSSTDQPLVHTSSDHSRTLDGLYANLDTVTPLCLGWPSTVSPASHNPCTRKH